MARKNKYKINGKVVNDDREFINDDSEFANDDLLFDDSEDFVEEEERAKVVLAIDPYPEDIDEDDLDTPIKKEKKRKKTRKEKLRYRGKYELLPEKENWKQIRFYRRRATPMAASLITGILALVFAFLAYKYNSLFSLATILIVVTGFIYSLIGFLKIRTKGVIVLIIGFLFSVIALIMIISPLKALYHQADQVKDALKDFLETLK